MATTSYTTPTMGINVVGARTDAAGAAATDTTAEEARYPHVSRSEGYVTPADSFKVQAQTVPDMTVKVGSGVSKSDYYVVAGEVAGQGNYLARLDVTAQNMTIDAADASQARTDEIYLVVRDHVYDASSRVLPQLAYRKGDLGGANPGVDSAWRASVILARITVAAAATTITNANITDLRAASSDGSIQKTLVDAKGDLLVGTAADAIGRLAVAANGQILMTDSAQSTGVKWSDDTIPKSLVNAKGDLLAATADNTVARLAIGAVASSVLMVDSAESTGMKWGSQHFTKHADVTFPGGSFSATFLNISQNFKHLKLVIRGSSDGGFGQIYARINGDTAAHYDSQILTVEGTAVTPTRILSATAMEIGIVGASNPSTTEVVVADYTASVLKKLFRCSCAYLAAAGPTVLWSAASSNWTNVDPITSLTILLGGAGDFVAGSVASLYLLA